MELYRLVFGCLTLIAFSKAFVNSNECNDNLAATAKKVKSCPQNHKEWIKAAARKGCEKMANSCLSFEYHCVINAWGNETIEVCAPKLQIVGNNCAEYSQGGKRIQRNGIVPCKNCPSHYFSNETFKYQECYEHVKNAKTAHTTQLTTESISVESTEENVYQSTSVTPMENSARLVQNIDNQNTMSHIIIICVCVVVGLAGIIIVFTVKQRSWANKICSHFKSIFLQSEESKKTKPDSAIRNVEEGPGVQNCLLEKETQIQDVFYKLNESSGNANSNAVSS
ncbi:uncharacterized protein LOC128168967 [Crassostrea angulata]|uniref:uncharacterized protein LOC128168967 n=1 Tax=Magallana angulata TaxID=2784310 RepID=UPI0022B195AB|nr:uncharacterized protein LOC128168967 [Crassostrea angulata]